MTVALIAASPLQRRITYNALDKLDVDNVVSLSEGQSALELLTDGHVDILIVEKELPDMTGLELTREVRGREESAYTPILLLGDEFTRSEAIQAIEAGVNQMLLKPVHPEDLETKIAAMRNLRRSW